MEVCPQLGGDVVVAGRAVEDFLAAKLRGAEIDVLIFQLHAPVLGDAVFDAAAEGETDSELRNYGDSAFN